jgi:ADP-heptose:LPS heptosyltransferase
MPRTLVIRLSSLGDVAISIPLMYSVAQAYPNEEFLMITKPPFQEIFLDKPSNLEIIPVYTKTKHKGLVGLWRLIGEIGEIDQVADLHQVIRSIGICLYYRIKGKKVVQIDKERKGKKALTKRISGDRKNLKTSLERYHTVFRKLGFDFEIQFQSLFPGKRTSKEKYRIGIAPFAKHKGKIYPLEKMEKVIELLSQEENMEILLFGGKKEQEDLLEWEKKYPNTQSLAGKTNFREELQIINQLDLMISMDSANMHLAALTATPVISIWGATHPSAGFYPYQQDIALAIQTDLDCRPCSVFGDKECFRKDYCCLHSINPSDVVRKTLDFLTFRPNN